MSGSKVTSGFSSSVLRPLSGSVWSDQDVRFTTEFERVGNSSSPTCSGYYLLLR